MDIEKHDALEGRHRRLDHAGTTLGHRSNQNQIILASYLEPLFRNFPRTILEYSGPAANFPKPSSNHLPGLSPQFYSPIIPLLHPITCYRLLILTDKTTAERRAFPRSHAKKPDNTRGYLGPAGIQDLPDFVMANGRSARNLQIYTRHLFIPAETLLCDPCRSAESG